MPLKLKNFFYNFYLCFKKALIDTIDHDGVEHAGYLSFLMILSLFPFLVFLISIAGSFGGSGLGTQFISMVLANIPDEAASAIKPRVAEIVSGPPQSLLTLAILGAIWTASSTIEGLRTIFNRAYRVPTPPAYLWRRLMSIVQFLVLTFLILLAMMIIILAPVTLKLIFSYFHLDVFTEQKQAFLQLRYFFSVAIIFSIVAAAYYYIPNLKQGLINVCPGALMVVILWSLSASAFSYYLKNFDQVNLIYGSLASFIVTLLFFYLISMIFIFGAEFNYAIEKITGFKFVQKQKKLSGKKSRKRKTSKKS